MENPEIMSKKGRRKKIGSFMRYVWTCDRLPLLIPAPSKGVKTQLNFLPLPVVIAEKLSLLFLI